jgi:hypothetical protein
MVAEAPTRCGQGLRALIGVGLLVTCYTSSLPTKGRYSRRSSATTTFVVPQFFGPALGTQITHIRARRG